MDSNHVDGHKQFMVAQELVMTLFCILYVYPHVPSQLIDDQQTTEWYSIGSKEALQAAITKLLQSSPVMRSSIAPDETLAVLIWSIVCDVEAIDDALDLQLFHEDTPKTSRQMFHSICDTYKTITGAKDLTTREAMQSLFQMTQLLPLSFRIPTDLSDRSKLLTFCAERTQDWMQQYLASAPSFFWPQGLNEACPRIGARRFAANQR